MKRIFLFVVLAAMFVAVGFTTGTLYRYGDSVVKDGISIIFPPIGNRLIPYRDGTIRKYGFLHRHTVPVIGIPAEFDDVYNSEYKMVPVKKNGKWGAVDVSLEYSDMDNQPIVPCIYTKVLPISDTAVEVTMSNGAKKIIDIRNGQSI